MYCICLPSLWDVDVLEGILLSRGIFPGFCGHRRRREKIGREGRSALRVVDRRTVASPTVPRASSLPPAATQRPSPGPDPQGPHGSHCVPRTARQTQPQAQSHPCSPARSHHPCSSPTSPRPPAHGVQQEAVDKNDDRPLAINAIPQSDATRVEPSIPRLLACRPQQRSGTHRVHTVLVPHIPSTASSWRPAGSCGQE